MPITSFLNYLLLEKKYSRNTVIAYENDLLSFQNFCQKEFDTSDLLSIHYAQIRNWIVLLVNEGISNRSINRKLSSLKSFYKFFLKLEQIEASPLAKHKSLKIPKEVQVPFSEKEIMDVLELFEGCTDFDAIRNKLIIELFYSTGIRRAELLEIKIPQKNKQVILIY